MKDNYGRTLQCPKCRSENLGFILDAEGIKTKFIVCKDCGMFAVMSSFRANPTEENPSRRDSDIGLIL